MICLILFISQVSVPFLLLLHVFLQVLFICHSYPVPAYIRRIQIASLGVSALHTGESKQLPSVTLPLSSLTVSRQWFPCNTDSREWQQTEKTGFCTSYTGPELTHSSQLHMHTLLLGAVGRQVGRRASHLQPLRLWTHLILATSVLHSEVERSQVQSVLSKEQLWICITRHRKNTCR